MKMIFALVYAMVAIGFFQVATDRTPTAPTWTLVASSIAWPVAVGAAISLHTVPRERG